MAQRVTASLVDDIDGSEASETVVFGTRSRWFEIDLSAEHAAEVNAYLDRLVSHSRPSRRVRTAASRRRTAQVRAWAREHGMTVPDRGRLPQSVIREYERAQAA